MATSQNGTGVVEDAPGLPIDGIAYEDADVNSAMRYFYQKFEDNTPENTTQNYKPKQEEWRQWCSKQNFPPIPPKGVWKGVAEYGKLMPGDLVDEPKLLAFLVTVVKRPLKRGKALTQAKKRLAEYEA